jgi:hypothetical protein
MNTTFSPFGRRKKGPDKAFSHAEGCRIGQADAGVSIPWSYLGDGLWKAECACGAETYREPLVDDRVRLDPLDPKTSRNLPQCEFAATEPGVLKILLKVKPGLGDGYDWVECGASGAGWQVPHYAQSVG